MSFKPDPKQGKRIVDQDVCDAYVTEVGACMACGKPNRTWRTKGGRIRNSLTFHHIIKKSQGGDDVPEDGIVLCGSGTTGCHGEAEMSVRDSGGYVRPIRMTIRQIIERHPEKRAYVVRKKSEGWLDRFYPATGERRRRGETL